MPKYIYQYPNWPTFTWQDAAINVALGEVRHLQGKISGQMDAIGFSFKNEATLLTLTLDVVKSSEIEGELLNYDHVRSSIAKRLGINIGGITNTDRNVDGLVEMMLDATQGFALPLSDQRLFGWQAALFPTGFSGSYKIEVGQYRTGEMQIVSGALGKEKVHYEAIPATKLATEMTIFLDWFNATQNIDPVLKAAIAHFWFIIIHPFDDGNGRIARALTDLLLTRSENRTERFYSMSSQILVERKRYYEVLQSVQHNNEDITEWLNWFLQCLRSALLETEKLLQGILQKAKFWQKHEFTPINERQRLLINKLLDGFDGKLKTSKWAKIAKCSADTALRDIKDLLQKGILQQEAQGGRSTHYILASE